MPDAKTYNLTETQVTSHADRCLKSDLLAGMIEKAYLAGQITKQQRAVVVSNLVLSFLVECGYPGFAYPGNAILFDVIGEAQAA